MKKILLASAIILMMGFVKDVRGNTLAPADGYFYAELSSHGIWLEIGAGVVAWRPHIIKTGWAPYRLGRWIWTDYGWYWDSYEPFGYIVYHYGRWYYDDYYGWIWIPDYEWAPAWVEWRYDDDYIGWAPLSPYATFSISFGIHFTHSYYVPYHHWHFVRVGYFCDPYVYNYFIAPRYKYRIHAHTKRHINYVYVNNRVRNYGVDFDFIRVRSRQDIKKRKIEEVRDPGSLRNDIGRNENVVRTFIADREQFSSDNLKNVKFEKSSGRSSLETSKIRLNEDLRKIETKSNTTSVVNEKRSNDIVKKNTDKKIDSELSTREFNVSGKNNYIPEVKKLSEKNYKTDSRISNKTFISEKKNTEKSRSYNKSFLDSRNSYLSDSKKYENRTKTYTRNNNNYVPGIETKKKSFDKKEPVYNTNKPTDQKKYVGTKTTVKTKNFSVENKNSFRNSNSQTNKKKKR